MLNSFRKYKLNILINIYVTIKYPINIPSTANLS